MKKIIISPHSKNGWGSKNDNLSYLDWLKKIKCFIQETYKGYLEIDLDKISDNDLLNLIMIFKRYKIPLSQLNFLKNKNNKYIFEKKKIKENGKFSRVYLKDENIIKLKDNILILTPLIFYTKEEEYIFLKWIKKINNIEKIEGYGSALYLYLSKIKKDVFFSQEELWDMYALFKRYKFKNIKQIKKIKIIDEHYCPLRIKKKERKNKEVSIKMKLLFFKKPTFNFQTDFYLFKELIHSMCCYENYHEKDNVMTIDFHSSFICDETLKHLFTLFDRYKIRNKNQLEIFKTEKSEHLFKANSKKDKGKFQYINQLQSDVNVYLKLDKFISIRLDPLFFYTEKDKELFFYRIKILPSVIAYHGMGPFIYIYFASKKIMDRELFDLISLFHRYQLQNIHQLNIFENKKNKHIFSFLFFEKKGKNIGK